MDEKLPWYGGVSNRQILMEIIRSLATALALAALVFAVLWWTGSRSYVAPASAAAGVVGYQFIKWRRRA